MHTRCSLVTGVQTCALLISASVSRPNIRGGGSLIQTRTLTRSISPLSTTSLFDASLTRPPPARGPKEYQLQCIVTSPAALAVGSFRLPAEALLFIAARLAVTGLVAPFTRLGTPKRSKKAESANSPKPRDVSTRG